jgi:hypothetical protein
MEIISRKKTLWAYYVISTHLNITHRCFTLRCKSDCFGTSCFSKDCTKVLGSTADSLLKVSKLKKERKRHNKFLGTPKLLGRLN